MSTPVVVFEYASPLPLVSRPLAVRDDPVDVRIAVVDDAPLPWQAVRDLDARRTLIVIRRGATLREVLDLALPEITFAEWRTIREARGLPLVVAEHEYEVPIMEAPPALRARSTDLANLIASSVRRPPRQRRRR